MKTEIKEILEAVRDGKVSVDDALLKIKLQPYEDIDFAKVDLHRAVRQGVPEVVYGAGKTAGQIARIMDVMIGNGQEQILITRIDSDCADELNKVHKVTYSRWARVAYYGKKAEIHGVGKILVATGGTSDIPVAEEAAVTAEYFGNEVVRVYDVGVAGLHRLLDHLEDIMSASVIIAVAGMEGALASVIGGLADCPVIAVPTSVGYGAAFEGLTALLSMLNSCAAGVSVVNIDNGFGAGYLAGMINRR